ncbi:MAG: T9SS type A sorting domain-containing protein [candidate division Zixibacteria bacterium]
MIKRLFVLLTVVFVMAFAYSYLVSAGEGDNRGFPEILTDCVTGVVTISYGDIDSCWPGEQLIVPVYASNDSILDLFKIYVTLTGNLNYLGYDSTDTPWNGPTVTEDTSGQIEITFSNGSLPISGREHRIFDLILGVSSTADFNSMDTVSYEQDPSVSYPSSQDYCYVVSGLTDGIITIPDDSVAIILDWETAYSYQAAATDDAAKDDFPAIIPLRLYTNFPCSTYSLIFQDGNWGSYFDFESNGGGAACSSFAGTDYIKIYGCPASKPGNDSTIYLGDLKMKISDYKTSYNADCAFSDTFFVGFRESYSGRKSFVYNWGGADSVGYAAIDADTGGVILPPYEVTIDAKDFEITENDSVIVQVTIDPSFYSADYKLWIDFDDSLLTLDTVITGGGTIPEIDYFEAASFPPQNLSRYRVESDSMFQAGKYAAPDTEQTLFTMYFTTTEYFDFGVTTDVKFAPLPDSHFVYDWFSDNDSGSKIRIDSSCISTSDATISRPAILTYDIPATLEPFSGGSYKMPVDITEINFTGDDHAFIHYTLTPHADSITEGNFTIDDWTIVDFKGWITIDLGEDISTTGILCYVWFDSSASGDFILKSTSWMKYNDGSDVAYVTKADTCHYAFSLKRPDPDTPVPFTYSLSQNYPNPFNANTQISFSIAEPGYTVMEIYDVLGRKITTLLSESMPAGNHVVLWNGTNLAGSQVAGGVYFYVIKANEYKDSRKMLYLK